MLRHGPYAYSVCVLIATTFTGSVPANKLEEMMRKWEYMIVCSGDVPSEGFFKSKDRNSLENYLNQLGAEGWELVNLHLEGLEFMGIAKREVTP